MQSDYRTCYRYMTTFGTVWKNCNFFLLSFIKCNSHICKLLNDSHFQLITPSLSLTTHRGSFVAVINMSRFSIESCTNNLALTLNECAFSFHFFSQPFAHRKQLRERETQSATACLFWYWKHAEEKILIEIVLANNIECGLEHVSEKEGEYEKVLDKIFFCCFFVDCWNCTWYGN